MNLLGLASCGSHRLRAFMRAANWAGMATLAVGIKVFEAPELPEELAAFIARYSVRLNSISLAQFSTVQTMRTA